MNTRLQHEYSAMEKNQERFLWNEIELDTKWGKPVWGVALQVDLAESVKDVVVSYQQQLDVLEPGKFLLLPRPYQHISVNQVVFWGGNYALGTQRTWERISCDFLSAFQQQDKRFPSFTITFSKLIATPGAIVWCASDEHDEMENLRATLLETLPFPSETTKRNHIIHTTVARYQQHLAEPRNVLEWVERQRETVTMAVRKIILKKELAFPSIKTETLAEIELI